MRLHVATVGSGPEVVRSVLYSIEKTHPEAVLLLATSKTRAQAEKIAQKLDEKSILWRLEECDQISDINEIVRCYRAAIETACKQYSADPAEISVDFTRGTKAMSAALVYVAVELRLGTLIYLDGQRGANGQIITGTERLISFTPGALFFQNDLKVLLNYFNTYRYAQGRERVQEIRGRYPNPKHQQCLDILHGLFEAYAAWDRFDLTRAIEVFKGLGRKLKASAGRSEGLRKIVNDATQTVTALKEQPWRPEWGLALLMAAQRRKSEGRLDVAVALLYRLIEFLAHQRLKERGFDPAGVAIDQLPDAVRSAWEPFAENGKLRLGLRRSYELLRDLGDPFGTEFVAEYDDCTSSLRHALDRRNLSVLAHGTVPVDEAVYRDLEHWVVPRLQAVVGKQYRRQVGRFCFPTLTPDHFRAMLDEVP